MHCVTVIVAIAVTNAVIVTAAVTVTVAVLRLVLYLHTVTVRVVDGVAVTVVRLIADSEWDCNRLALGAGAKPA